LVEQIGSYYKKEFNNKTIHKEIGDVIVSNSSVRDTLAHMTKFNKISIDVLKIIPQIIENGILISKDIKHKDKHYNTYLCGTPVMYEDNKENKKEYLVIFSIKESNDRMRTKSFYLHQIDTKENLLSHSLSHTGSNTPQENSYTSILSQRVQNVNNFKIQQQNLSILQKTNTTLNNTSLQPQNQPSNQVSLQEQRVNNIDTNNIDTNKRKMICIKDNFKFKK
jgi:hypothetical protein